MAEDSKPKRQVSQYTLPSTVNGVFMGRVATARAGSTQRANSITSFAIKALPSFSRFAENNV